MPPGHVFHPGHDEWHGQTVVVRTSGPHTVIGRWDAVVGDAVHVRDASVHDASSSDEPADDWIARLKQFGVPVQHPELTLPQADVTQVVRLRDA